MARGNELQSLVQQFVGQLQNVISKQVESEIAGKIDAFRNSILSATGAPAARAAVVAVVGGRRKSPLAGRSAELKPCPVCGTPNKARRFSYLCENHRASEYLSKFKGGAKAAPQAVAAKKSPAAAAPAAKPAKAAKAVKAPKAAGKRGPGRPKGSKNKKTAKSAGKTETPASTQSA